MSSNKIIIIICILTFIVLILSIIKTNSFFGIKNPNNRVFIKGNLIFRANLNIKGDRNYRVLDIGTLKNPFYKNPPRFKFKVNKELILKSDKIKVEELKKICNDITDPNEFDKRWPDGAERIHCGPYAFIVSNDVVWNFYTEFLANPVDKSEVLSIGNINTEKMYFFPLSQEQIIQVFGEPERIEEYFSW
ncbi:MAG: hypothetical protein K8R67_19505 [Desulfobacteraceae bacterium]|nr:hypothetical protein [Desulfobacteraceae bacterium]